VNTFLARVKRCDSQAPIRIRCQYIIYTAATTRHAFVSEIALTLFIKSPCSTLRRNRKIRIKSGVGSRWRGGGRRIKFFWHCCGRLEIWLLVSLVRVNRVGAVCERIAAGADPGARPHPGPITPRAAHSSRARQPNRPAQSITPPIKYKPK
jgi:hypothetical protein